MLPLERHQVARTHCDEYMVSSRQAGDVRPTAPPSSRRSDAPPGCQQRAMTRSRRRRAVGGLPAEWDIWVSRACKHIIH